MKPWPWEQPATVSAVDAARRKVKAKRSQLLGSWGQRVAAMHLRMLGFQCVEEIHTGTSMVRGVRRFSKPVSGDLRAVYEGRAVLVEVKVRPDRLVASDLEPHQREALFDHTAAGALALVAWVRPGAECALMAWPCFPDGNGLSWEDALAKRWRPSPTK